MSNATQHPSSPVDFGRAAAPYAQHRAGFPDRFFDDTLRGWGLIQPDHHALDVGCGAGSVALGLAQRGMRVTGLDPSTALLTEARRASAARNLFPAFIEARVEDTPLPDASQRLVTAGQCWHWFDRPAAATQCWRVLEPGGALVIAHLDFLMTDPIVRDTLALVREIGGDPTPGALKLGRHGLYPDWFADLTDAGFTELESRSFDLAIPYTREAWVGRMVASAGVGASRPQDDVDRFTALLRTRLGGEPDTLHIPHRVFALRGLKQR
jgi:SAM-dependent methyltransferase